MRRKKNLKLPNGFGSVSFIGEGRRKPYRARKTECFVLVDKSTGKEWPKSKKIPPDKLKDITYKPKYINIGTFETYQEAIVALHNYNKNPYDMEADKITLETVIEKWTDSMLPTFAPSTQEVYAGIVNRIPDKLCKMKMRSIKVYDLETAIADLNTTSIVAVKITTLLNHLFEFAIKHEFCEKNYAALIDVKAIRNRKSRPNNHNPLSEDEIAVALSCKGIIKDILHVALYTGMRPNELVTLTTEHVFLTDGYIRHGSKTTAGKNRIIPIHKEIAPIIELLTKKSHTGYLFEYKRSDVFFPISYTVYYNHFRSLLPGHKPHDTRHTFITRWRSELVLDDAILHMIVGHEDKDISEKVYTHRPTTALIEEMQRFHYGENSIAIFKRA